MKLWIISLDRGLTDEERCALLCCLPQARLKRLQRIPHMEAWREPLCAYGLLFLAAKETWGWSALPTISLTEQGKPVFPDHPSCCFNVSHTSGAVLVGLGEQPIGVDLERIRPLSQRFLRRLKENGQTLEDYYEDWVRYEASVKCRGEGVHPHHTPEEGADAELVSLLPDYKAAVCGEPVTDLYKLTLEELLQELKSL